MMRFEKRHEPLLSMRHFIKRQLLYVLFAAVVLGLSLYGGMAGFHYLESLSWLDALVNATMLLGGEGPLAPLQTEAGKYFASFYAVYSGVVFLLAFSILITPMAHRLFHHFHLPVEEDVPEPRPSRTRRKKRRA